MSKLSFQELDIKMERGDKENPLYLVVHTHAHTTNIVAMWCIKKIFSCAFHNLSGCVAISTCRLKNKRLPDPWIDLKNLWVHLIKKHNCSGGSVWTPGCEGSALLRKAHVECREGEGKVSWVSWGYLDGQCPGLFSHPLSHPALVSVRSEGSR